jgi:hypothetical protein
MSHLVPDTNRVSKDSCVTHHRIEPSDLFDHSVDMPTRVLAIHGV